MMTRGIEYLQEHGVYDNPMPLLRSRHAFFPGVIQLPSGELLAMIAIGEAFESTDMTTCISRSTNNGQTWQLQGPVYDKSVDPFPTSDYLKPLALADGSLMALGYRFHRHDPNMPIGIEATNGILPGDDIVSFSSDEGRTWTVPQVIECDTVEVLEVPHNPIQLHNGDIVASAGLFKSPEGKFPRGQFGVLMRSKDNGKSWDASARFFETPDNSISAYESNVIEMQDGRLVTISWAIDVIGDRDFANQVTVSHDNGYTWSEPIDTGHAAQSSSLIYLGGERLMSIHCHRGDEPGVVVRVIDFTGDKWNVIGHNNIWGSSTGKQVHQGQSFYDMMQVIRFGQPSLLKLDNGEVLGFHWAVVNGQGMVLAHRLKLSN